MSSSIHKTVLLEETMQNLNLRPNMTLLDATINGGGHSAEAVERLSGKISVVGLDQDSLALERAKNRINPFQPQKLNLIEANFRNMGKVAGELSLKTADAIIFDLGLSSDQLEQSGRGFSFEREEPLLMTFSDHPTDPAKTADAIVNRASEEELAGIFKEYGEEPRARRYASAIVVARARKRIETAKELAEIILNAAGGKGRRHPATKVFQALRMAANQELESLEEALPQAFSLLSPNGRLLVISFHSGEDRIVKNFMRGKAAGGEALLINKKPITPGREEVLANPRSRSAKLRVLQKAN